jgi:uncharacterized membrane protein
MFSFLRFVKVLLLYAALAFFSFLLLKITLQYLPVRYDVAFLRIKQQYIAITHWRWAFFVHVFTSMLVLVAGFTQFSKTILTRLPLLHRAMGYLYIVVLLGITGPASFIMALYANGGFTSRAAFTTLAVLWWFTTLQALLSVRRRDFVAHRNYMWRSYALTLSAVTLRAWKYLIVWALHPPPMEVYRIVAWLGFVPNLLLVEWWIRRQKN